MPGIETELLHVGLAGDGLPVARTSAVLVRPIEPPPPTAAAFVLAHGAGTDRTHPFQLAVAGGLAGRGHPVLLFNFAYTEAGRKRPDTMPRLESVYRAVVAEARARWTDRPLVLGGRSMGGRVASHLAASGVACDGLALLCYPLHPAGRPERLRSEHWPHLDVPVLFVSGDRDALCDLELLEAERRHLTSADHRLHVVTGADHGFRVRVRDGRTGDDVLAEVTEAIAGWAADAVPRGSGRE